jgi:putative ABC transport system permease protein
MNKMILANLLHRPVRSLISVFAVAVEVTLILVIVGLSLGLLNDNKGRQKAVGADALVRPPGSSNIMSLSGAPVSMKVADVIRKIPHVTMVSPAVLQVSSNAVETIWGIDLPTFNALGNPFRYIEGGPFQGPNDIIVDDFFASSKHVHVGDYVDDVLNHQFRVSGIVEHGKGGRKFLPLTTLQELIGAQGKATIFYVKLDSPSNFAAFKDSVLQVPGMERYTVTSMEEWLSLMTPEKLPGFAIFIDTVIGVAVCIGFIVIFQAMYTAVMERTREIGILKSLGASKLYIVNVILRETLLLAVLGVLLGIAISFVTQQSLMRALPTLRPEFDPHWVLLASIIALVGAVLGALYPAFKAAQKDPIDALAYE